MTTRAERDAIVARFRTIQSVGGSLLSNATYGIRDTLAITVSDDPEPTPTPVEPVEPTPAPVEPTPPAPSPIMETLTGDVAWDGRSGTVRGLRVTGELLLRNCRDLVLEDCAFGALSMSSSQRITVRRFEVDGRLGKDGIHVTSDGATRCAGILLEDGLVHSPDLSGASHYDGIHVRGVEDLTVRDVVFDQGDYDREDPLSSLDSRLNASVFLEDANGGNRRVLLERVTSRVRGYHHLYLYAAELTIRDSVFHAFPHAKLLYSGSTTAFTQEGNTWADGSPLTIR